ncbi:MAG: ATP-grasp domain-containing protein [Anaerolineales bacterium]|nr:MAG: ATP-grasp domain-containing protein [Anaerolineales bacterium]
MFFVDEPYISDILKRTLRDNAIPVVATQVAKKLGLLPGTNWISEARAVELAREPGDPRIYIASENSIGWIARHLAFSDLPEKIELFKNKAKFRELTRPLYPDFFYKEVGVEDLKDIRVEDLPLPFIIKPTAGFFSMGVHKVTDHADWPNTLAAILAEIEQIKGLYPHEVLNINSFIIEECIEGEEFALDAYLNSAGEPVILSIYRHTFSSASDVGDRVYTTSKAIVEHNLQEFTNFVGEMGRLTGIRNFPLHIELRRADDSSLLPIEVNPMRFGGWCSTADLTSLAYGYNPYLYYYTGQKPDWTQLLAGKDGKLFSMIVLDNSTGIPVEQITSFDYAKLLTKFEKPLDLRQIDYKKYHVFGFLFAETRADNLEELEDILKSDLREFIST